MVMMRGGGWPVRYLLLICGDESAAEHADEAKAVRVPRHPAASSGTIEVWPLP
jgi:hypothetical protein